MLFDKELHPELTLSKKCEPFFSEKRKENREEYEELWQKFKSIAPDDFQKTFLTDANKFDPYTWEMILGAKLLDSGFELSKCKNDHPDLCIKTKNGSVAKNLGFGLVFCDGCSFVERLSIE